MQTTSRPDWHTTANELVERNKQNSPGYQMAAAYAKELNADLQGNRLKLMNLLDRMYCGKSEEADKSEAQKLIEKFAVIAKVDASWQRMVLNDILADLSRKKKIFLWELIEEQEDLLYKIELLRFVQRFL